MEERSAPMTWGGPMDGFETPEQALCRVRRRVAAAGVRGGKSWDELFSVSDKNRDGQLCWKEVHGLIRNSLRLPPQSVCDYELRLLFNALDSNGSGSVDAAELVAYIQHGPRRPQDDDAQTQVRLHRVRRNLRLAMQMVAGSEWEWAKLFSQLDRDSSNRLSKYEFQLFVRNDLGLSRWDVQNSALDEFYDHLDRDGDGIDVKELMDFVRAQGKEKRLVGAQSLYVAPDVPKLDRKRKTHRQKLMEGMQKSSSLPALTHAFTNLGRDRRPITRLSV